MEGDPDLEQVQRDIGAAVASQRALARHLESLAPVDPATPSLLPGWTVGHVLTHIARNADGHRSMLDGLPQYPHGPAGRNADIEQGSTRAWGDLVDDVGSSAEALAERWSTHGSWTGNAVTLTVERPLAMLPFLRQREVEVHRADLGLGYGFDDMPGEYVRRELRMMDMLWKARQPMGMTPLPPAALAVSSPVRLAWLMGRADIAGLEPARIF